MHQQGARVQSLNGFFVKVISDSCLKKRVLLLWRLCHTSFLLADEPTGAFDAATIHDNLFAEIPGWRNDRSNGHP